MLKKPLTKEQEINLLWLEIKKTHNECSQKTYEAVKRDIIKGKRITHIKGASAIESKYLEIFTMPKNAEFITECFRVQERLQEMVNVIFEKN